MRFDRRSRRVLVADGSATWRAVATRVLGDAGYQVGEAGDAAGAVRAAIDPAGRVDLLLVDLEIDGQGLEVLRRIRARPEGSPTPAVVAVGEAISLHLRRVLDELGVAATLSRDEPLRDVLYLVDAQLFPAAADLRRGRRRLVRLPVNYWVGDELHLRSSLDLSERGMFVVLADEPPPEVGTRLQLRFWLPTADRLVVCEGRVQWVNSGAADLRLSHPPGMGVEFTAVAPADVDLIRGFLERAR